ncbi:DUF1835 domain-containing protein [Litchfieldia alkalitelluris]|uniref:DUF1835 domain-containing protein n=1 Tax=Litchfieldia alkalitelluris TaxID=304268 RepID=UPI000996F649|nr:DUF1835 domain-containing protein [Litchfieldia alkalitelluris]
MDPLRGSGYFINQQDLNLITIEINKQIKEQKSNTLDKDNYIVVPVHIVSSESAAGAIRVGIDRPKHVIGFQDPFSIGPLWSLHERIGQSYRKDWFYDHINFEDQDDYQYCNKFANTLLEIDDISEQAPVFIWTANNAEEQIGLRYILYLLRNKANNIYIINSTDSYTEDIMPDHSRELISHTSQVQPIDLKVLFERNKAKNLLPHHKKEQFIKDWENLSQSKEVLRIWNQEEILNVSENYYDEQIIHIIETLHKNQERKDFIKTVIVIAEFMDNSNELVNVFYLEYRIRELIYNGKLELKGVPKSMRHYSVKLK